MSCFNPTIQCPCDRSVGETGFCYDEPPAGETLFDLKGQVYRRSYWRCGLCGHEFSEHDIDLSGLYDGPYVEHTYGERVRATFDRILALRPEASDNTGRVRRVLDFAAKHFPPRHCPSLLDVGAGLGVFPFRMKEAGWECTALDPAPQVEEHLSKVVGVRTVSRDFLKLRPEDLGRFDVITLNKVIEHVADPVTMLRKVVDLQTPGGFVYVEVPDVAAAVEGPGREEYFIEHHHVFSPASLANTAARSGLEMLSMQRLREPSGKYTIVMFACVPQ